MQLVTRMPTRHYFITMFVIVSALFFTFSVVIYRNYQQAQQISSWTLYHYEVARQSRKILFDLIGMETGVRGYLLTGRNMYLEPYESSQRNLIKQIGALQSYTENDPQVSQNMDAWLKQITRFSQTLDEQLEIAQSKGRQAVPQTIMAKQKVQMDGLRLTLESFIQKRLENLKVQIAESKDAHRNFKYILAIGTLLAIGGMLLATLVILSLVARSRQSERQARELEERFLTVMIGVNDGLYDLDLITNHIYYSPSYKSMLGYADHEFANTVQASFDNIHPEDIQKTKEVVASYTNGETAHYNNTFRMLHKNGNWVWILSRGIGLRDEKGRMIRLIGTHTDITEQKKREEELAIVNSEMEAFTYITSHDLRAPLVNMRGFATEMSYAVNRIKPLLENVEHHLAPDERKVLKDSLESDIAESLKFIEQSVVKMDALTTALLDLSRIGRREYRVEKVDTQSVVQRCLDTLAYEITQKNIKIHRESLPSIMSDSLALEQVFSNILDNAIKYLDPARTGEISISARTTDTEIVFSITDNGRGISADDRHKVFQIFRRARNSNDVRGMGMGMAFVQATVRRLGGSIWFNSEVGQGTTFFIKLPKNPKLKGLSI